MGYTYTGSMSNRVNGVSDEMAIEALKKAGQKFSEQQEQILKTSGAMEIVSCAGSGKTHTLVNLIIKRILTGEILNPKRVLLTTFTKAGADNMQERLNSLYNKVGFTGSCPVEVRTMHSIYLRFLKKCVPNMPRVISESERMGYVRSASRVWKTVLTEDELQSVSTLLSYQINTMANLDAMYNSHIFNLEMSLETFKQIHANFYSLKQTDGVMDFDDMLFQTFWHLYNVPNEEVRNSNTSLIREFDDIYIDEFQDTSMIQFYILMKMITNPNKCLFIGDDDQCIYEWRGSEPSLMLGIMKYFPDIKKLHLDTNYRCRSTILSYANTGIKYIANREEKSMVSFNEGGEVNFIFSDCGKLYETTIKTCDKIQEIVSNGEQPENIAVLSRYNATSSLLQAELIFRDIKVSADSGVRVTSLSYFRDLNLMVSLLDPEGVGNRDPKVAKTVLWKIVPYFGAKNSDKVASIMKNTGLPLLKVLEILLYYSGYPVTDKGVELGPRVMGMVEGLARSLSTGVRASILTVYKQLSKLSAVFENEEEKNEAYTKVCHNLLECYYSSILGLTKKKSSMRLLKAFYVYFMNKCSSLGYMQFRQFIDKLSMYDSLNVPDGVRMVTMHGAKGLEWKHVFLFAYDNYTFPDVQYALDKATGEDEFSKFIDGERRLAYVAATRASEHLYIVTDNNKLSYLALEQLGLAVRALRSIGHTEANLKNSAVRDFFEYIGENFVNPVCVCIPEDCISYKPR